MDWEIMKACQHCGYMGEETYCPDCRKRGKISKLKTAQQMTYYIDQMRKKAVKMQGFIKQLEGL